jgi:hypothetical protein
VGERVPASELLPMGTTGYKRTHCHLRGNTPPAAIGPRHAAGLLHPPWRGTRQMYRSRYYHAAPCKRPAFNYPWCTVRLMNTRDGPIGACPLPLRPTTSHGLLWGACHRVLSGGVSGRACSPRSQGSFSQDRVARDRPRSPCRGRAGGEVSTPARDQFRTTTLDGRSTMSLTSLGRTCHHL